MLNRTGRLLLHLVLNVFPVSGAAFLLPVGCTHAVFCSLAARGDVDGAQRLVVHLFLVFLLNAAKLVNGYTSLHQLGDNLLTGSSFCILFDNVVHNLAVCHGRLRKRIRC